MGFWDKKKEVMTKYNLTANLYNRLYAEEQTSKIEAVFRTLSINENSYVLDAGCGSGLLFPYLANNTRFIIGLDLSKQLLLHAKKAMIGSNFHLVNADVDHIPLKEDLFDYIFSLTLLQNSPMPLTTVNELIRVAKDTSLYVFTGFKKKFRKQDFIALLQKAKLKIIHLLNNTLHCYIAICII